MARDRQRAKQRRRRQGGHPTARAAGDSGTARDIGLDDATADDAGLGDGTPAPDPLKHASADVDEARLAEAGAIPPEVGDEDDLAPGVYEDELHGDDDFERAPDESEDDAAAAVAARTDEAGVERAPRRQRGRV